MQSSESKSQTPAKSRRKTFFIYKPIQILILKVILTSCTLSVVAVLSATGLFYAFLLTGYLNNQMDELYQSIILLDRYRYVYLVYVFIALVFSTWLIIYAWLKLSHKIAGPLYRMRANLKEYVEDGKDFNPIKLRDDDELKDLAQLINAAIEKKGGSAKANSGIQ